MKGAANFAIWADFLRMVRDRHPLVAELMIRHLEEGIAPCFQAVRQCKDSVTATSLVVPFWTELSLTPPEDLEDPEPHQRRHGWQQKATRQLEEGFSTHVVWPGLNDSRRALLRFQHGVLASAALTALPTLRATRIDPSRSGCSCVEGCTYLSHCLTAPADVPPTRRVWPPSRSVFRGRVVEEEGVPSGVRRRASLQGRRCLATNVFLRDMDLATFNALDGRRLEIVADGLTLWRGAQLVVDTTIVSPLRRDGSPKPGATNHDEAALEAVRRKKESRWFSPLRWEADGMLRRCSSSQLWPELVLPLVLLQGKAEAAWVRRWSAILACTAARAFTVSLLDSRPAVGTGDFFSRGKPGFSEWIDQVCVRFCLIC